MHRMEPGCGLSQKGSQAQQWGSRKETVKPGTSGGPKPPGTNARKGEAALISTEYRGSWEGVAFEHGIAARERTDSSDRQDGWKYTGECFSSDFYCCDKVA